MKLEFSPEKLIDREGERELFNGMLHFKDDARLLTITDGGGHGKSALLKRMEYDCQWAGDDATRHVALVPLDELRDPTEFGWVEFTRDKLGPKARFDTFDALMRARAQRSDVVFTRGTSVGGAMAGTLDARAASLGGSQNVYTGINSPIEKADNVYITPRTEWTSSDQETLARKECINAFLGDLKTICANEPVVLLMDVWERCNAALQRWITVEFLKSQCFDVNGRPEKLVLVIAGRQVPPFRDMLRDRYDRLVKSISSLGEWNERHVKEFLSVHGYTDVTDGDVNYVCEKLKSGWSLQKALKMVEEFLLAR